MRRATMKLLPDKGDVAKYPDLLPKTNKDIIDHQIPFLQKVNGQGIMVEWPLLCHDALISY
jgi:hypothetical protein